MINLEVPATYPNSSIWNTQIETLLCINLYLNIATGHSVLFQIKIETCLLQIYGTTSILPNKMLEGDHGNRILQLAFTIMLSSSINAPVLICK